MLETFHSLSHFAPSGRFPWARLQPLPSRCSVQVFSSCRSVALLRHCSRRKQDCEADLFATKLAQRCNALSCFEASEAMQKQEHNVCSCHFPLHSVHFFNKVFLYYKKWKSRNVIYSLFSFDMEQPSEENPTAPAVLRTSSQRSGLAGVGQIFEAVLRNIDFCRVFSSTYILKKPAIRQVL